MYLICKETQGGFLVEIGYEKQKETIEEVENEPEKDLRNLKDLENEPEKDLRNPKDLEKNIEEYLTENQKQILEAIEINIFITQQELSSIVGINEKNIRNNIDKLKSKGLLERIGPNKGGYWKIKREYSSSKEWKTLTETKN